MAVGQIRVLAFAIVLLVGCAAPRTVLEPVGGQITVLGPAAGFSPDTLSTSWVSDGTSDQVAVVDKEGVLALRLASRWDGFILARLTRAKLLATPYLSWAWNMGPHDGARHPVGLVVGFHGGNPRGPNWGGYSWHGLGVTLPLHDRRLAIVWDAAALKRGSFDSRAGDARPRYVQRGGRENTGSWWLETADLADLYARAWPQDDRGRVGIVFIGLAGAPADTPAQAHVSGILLSR